MKLIKENIPFTMVANEVLKDKNLSFKAKGLYAYLFSKPDEWDFSGHRMTLETSDGKKAIFNTLKELETRGYLSRIRLSNGRVEYTLKHSLKSLVPETDTGEIKPSTHFGYKPKRLQAERGTISKIDNTSNKEERVIQNSDSKESPEKNAFLTGKEIGELTLLFKEVNPMYESFYANKTERKALNDLAKTIGVEKLRNTIIALKNIISQPFAPRITKPTELKRDLGKLLIFYNQQKNSIVKQKPTVIY